MNSGHGIPAPVLAHSSFPCLQYDAIGFSNWKKKIPHGIRTQLGDQLLRPF